MQALETIERLNAEATAAEIPKLRNAGKYVVCVYAGLNYLQHADFDTEAQAQAYIDKHALDNNAGERTQLLEPTEPKSEESIQPDEQGSDILTA